jgi:mannosyl-3-phosphoglycerate synthase
MPSDKVVVFTDIDGTLIDINTGEYGKNTSELICTLKENNIPVVLASAKTWVEQNKIREDLGLTDPFIVENGGAIVIPKGYFPYSYLEDIQYPLREVEEQQKDTEEEEEEGQEKEIIVAKEREMKHKNINNLSITMIVIELGKPADQVRAKLADLRKKYNINFKGVADVSLEELSKIASMPLDYAKRMSKRDYGETILQIERNDIARFVKYAEEESMRVIHGGRFFDVTIGNDKGKAVNIVRDLFKNKYHNDDVTFFGIGDSENDVPMLNLVDVPILVQRPDSSWFNYEGTIIKKDDGHHDDVIKVNGIGPKGWENAIYNIILRPK